MSFPRRLSSVRTLWIIGRLMLRRQLNLWQSVRLGRKKKKNELTSLELRPAAVVRSGTAGKSSGRSLFSAFLLLVMGFNGFNLASIGLQRLSDRVRNIVEPSDTIRVSPYTEKQLKHADRSMKIAERISDPVERKRYEDMWNGYVDHLFRDEIQRSQVSEEEESGQLRQMHEVFAAKGASGFTASTVGMFRVSAETWPRDVEAKSMYLRVLGLIVLLWIPAMVFGALGTNNKDLGQVEWSFEWLYTFPASARALFASKILSSSFLNPIAWIFFLPFLIMVYIAGGYGWMAIPLGFGAFVWVLILVGAVATICEVTMRKFLSLSQLKNIQALFTVLAMVSLMLVFASSFSKPLDDFLVGRAASAGALRWNPFSLPLYLGVSSAATRQIQFAVLGMIAVAFGSVSIALLGSEWLTREGLIRASGPYQGRRQTHTAASSNIWLRGIAAHEMLLLARDRNLMVQVLIVPLLIPAYYLLTNSRIVTAVGTSLRHAAMMAFAVGAYSFLNSAMPILNREGKTLWYLLCFPHSLSSILLKKAMVWAVIGLTYGGVVLLFVARFSHHWQVNAWGDVFLALYGILLYAFIASGIGILATNVLETTRRARFWTEHGVSVHVAGCHVGEHDLFNIPVDETRTVGAIYLAGGCTVAEGKRNITLFAGSHAASSAYDWLGGRHDCGSRFLRRSRPYSLVSPLGGSGLVCRADYDRIRFGWTNCWLHHAFHSLATRGSRSVGKDRSGKRSRGPKGASMAKHSAGHCMGRDRGFGRIHLYPRIEPCTAMAEVETERGTEFVVRAGRKAAMDMRSRDSGCAPFRRVSVSWIDFQRAAAKHWPHSGSPG